MIRVQYARRHHIKIGFKGLKDESFSMTDNNLDDSSQVVINNLLYRSKEEENKNH